jgi:hypothetical protein
VEKYKDIATDFIELTGRKEDFLTKVKLAKRDYLVGFASADSVEFRATVQKTIAIKTFESVPVIVSGLDPRFAVEGTPPTGSLRIQGSSPDLAAWKPPEGLLSVECSEVRKPGLYTLPVRVEALSEFLVLNHDPEAVTIRVVETGKGKEPGAQ